MTLSVFEKEILAMGIYLERTYGYNIYGEYRDFVNEYLKKEGVSVNDLPHSKNVTLNLRGPKEKNDYVAQAPGLLLRILPPPEK